MKKKHFFTLVEILVATGIIAVLAGIGFAGYSFAMNSGRTNATKTLIAQLTTALDTCQNKIGFYPASSGYGEIKFTLTKEEGLPIAVSFKNTTFEKNSVGSQKKFFNLFTKTLDLETVKMNLETVDTKEIGEIEVEIKVLRDSWGNAILYRHDQGCINTGKYDIISAGEDGGFGEDKAPAPETARTKYIDTEGNWLCDDVANF